MEGNQETIKKYFRLRRFVCASKFTWDIEILSLMTAALLVVDLFVRLVFTQKLSSDVFASIVLVLAVRLIFGVHGLARRGVIPCDARQIEQGLRYRIFLLKNGYFRAPIKHWVLVRVGLMSRSRTWGIDVVPLLEKSMQEFFPEISSGLSPDAEIELVSWTSSFHYDVLFADVIIQRWLDQKIEQIKTELHLPLAQIEFRIAEGAALETCVRQMELVVQFESSIRQARKAILKELLRPPHRVVTPESITAYVKSVRAKVIEVCVLEKT